MTHRNTGNSSVKTEVVIGTPVGRNLALKQTAGKLRGSAGDYLGRGGGRIRRHSVLRGMAVTTVPLVSSWIAAGEMDRRSTRDRREK